MFACPIQSWTRSIRRIILVRLILHLVHDRENLTGSALLCMNYGYRRGTVNASSLYRGGRNQFSVPYTVGAK